MINIFQRHWHSSTRLNPPRPNIDTPVPGEIIAETIYGDTDNEVGVRLLLDPGTFKIQEAFWETYSLPVTTRKLPQLLGETAYFNVGGAINKLAAEFSPETGRLLRTLLNETVGCVILTEPFMTKERGYTKYSDYRIYWDEIYVDVCRYYSRLATDSELWDYSAFNRTEVLFNRFAQQSVFALSDGSWHITAAYRDTFHEISVLLDIDKSFVVTKAIGRLVRTPHQVCPGAADYMERLIGYDARDFSRKPLVPILGAGDGCVHLIDTVCDALTALNMAASRQNAV